jgi:hypothetical protein
MITTAPLSERALHPTAPTAIYAIRCGAGRIRPSVTTNTPFCHFERSP